MTPPTPSPSHLYEHHVREAARLLELRTCIDQAHVHATLAHAAATRMLCDLLRPQPADATPPPVVVTIEGKGQLAPSEYRALIDGALRANGSRV